MMRQTAAEIDHTILDVAAGIFATYGFTHSSVQQIADAVGYSKPGLLHRFGSKEALHRAVLDEVSDIVQQVVGHAVAHRGEVTQGRQVLEVVTLKALDRPGMVQMMLRSFESADQPVVEPVQGWGHRLMDALDQPWNDPAQRLRVVLALQLIGTAAVIQHSTADGQLRVDRDEIVPLIVSLATHVLEVHSRIPA